MSLLKMYLNRVNIVNDYTAQPHTLGKKKKHIRSYQRYFFHWTTREQIGKSGNVRCCHVYIGPTFHVNLMRKTFVLRKITMSLIALLAFGLLFLSIFLMKDTAQALYIVIPQCGAIICLLFLLWYSLIRCMHKQVLTIGEYQEAAKGYPTCALISTLLLLMNALAVFIQCASSAFSVKTMISFFAVLFAAGCTLFLIYIELSTEYVFHAPEE